MSNFDPAFDKTMGREGAWVNNPNDRGKETFAGIARAFWGTWQGWPIIDSIKVALGVQPPFDSLPYWQYVKKLNPLLRANAELQGLVKEFYRKNFWGRLGEVNDQRIAEELFDKGVNCGAMAAKWMQRALDLPDDGVIGPQTVKAINAYIPPSDLLQQFNEQARKFYEGLIAKNPSQAQFRKSWFGRLRNYDESQFNPQEETA